MNSVKQNMQTSFIWMAEIYCVQQTHLVCLLVPTGAKPLAAVGGGMLGLKITRLSQQAAGSIMKTSLPSERDDKPKTELPPKSRMHGI